MRTSKEDTKAIRISMQRSFAAGGWFMMPKDFIRALNSNHAILLAFLINVADMVKAEERAEGWFYCKMSRIEMELGFSVRVQSEIVRNMIKRGLIKTKRIGVPAQRYFRIQYDALQKLLDALPPLEPML